jgi:hypothetical protein
VDSCAQEIPGNRPLRHDRLSLAYLLICRPGVPRKFFFIEKAVYSGITCVYERLRDSPKAFYRRKRGTL